MFLQLIHNGSTLDLIVESFEKEIPDQCKYIVTKYKSNKTGTSIKQNDKANYAFSYSKEYYDLIGDVNQYEAIIVHSMTPFHAKLVNTIFRKKIICWFVWGGDVYGTGIIRNEKLLMPLTHNALNNTVLKKIKSYIKSYYLNNFLFLFPEKKALQKVDICIPVLPNEYNLFKKKINKFRAEYFPKIYTTESFFKVFEQIELRKDNKINILVGHSGNIYGNQLDALDILSRVNLNNLSVVTPVVYGNKQFINLIVEKGNQLFGKNYFPLKEKLSHEKYVDLINTCRIGILNTFRQQAVGNLYAMLFTGCKVYLQKEGVLYEFCQQIGAKVFSIEDDLVPQNAEALSPLSIEEMIQNRTAIVNFINQECYQESSKKLIIRIREMVSERVSDSKESATTK